MEAPSPKRAKSDTAETRSSEGENLVGDTVVIGYVVNKHNLSKYITFADVLTDLDNPTAERTVVIIKEAVMGMEALLRWSKGGADKIWYGDQVRIEGKLEDAREEEGTPPKLVCTGVEVVKRWSEDHNGPMEPLPPVKRRNKKVKCEPCKYWVILEPWPHPRHISFLR